METEQKAGNCPSQGQTTVRTWLPSNTRGVVTTAGDFASRFHGDGVRYKAKLIGMDPVPAAQGEKMCWESMMKLKGIEEASRKQGRHKQRIWFNICSSCLKIVDERTGTVLHTQEKSNISSLTRDGSDPRAFAYVYQHHDSYILFYIKTANQAASAVADIIEVCQSLDQNAPGEPEPAPPAQNIPLLPLNDSATSTAEGAAPELVFSPRPESSAGPSNQISSHNELMEVFSTPLEDPLTPTQTVNISNASPEPPQEQYKPMLSTSQILSMFPPQPAGGPPYSPSTMPWSQQMPIGNPWAGPAGPMAGGISGWAPPGVSALPAVGPQPGGLMEGAAVSSPASPTAFTQQPLNSYSPTGTTGALPFSASSNNPLL